MNCEYCQQVFCSRNSLKTHQKTAKYCLERQGKTDKIKQILERNQCSFCNESFTCGHSLRRHQIKCTQAQQKPINVNNEDMENQESDKQIVKNDPNRIQLTKTFRDIVALLEKASEDVTNKFEDFLSTSSMDDCSGKDEVVESSDESSCQKDNDQLFSCSHPDCNFPDSGKSVIMTHERLEHGIYGCHWCGKKFSKFELRNNHEKIHTKDKPFPCRKGCDKRFAFSSVRQTHERVHTGERPFPCRKGCDKHFVYSCDRTRHENCTHLWPLCVICLEKRVKPQANRTTCGLCTSGVTYGSKQKTVFNHLFNYSDEYLDEVMWTLLDKHMGCGVNRRPDGLMIINTDKGTVKFILEVDEDEHKGNTPECELSRLYEIQDRDNDAIYVLRYNPDAKDALEEDKLDDLAERILEIISKDYVKALESINLIHVEYIGYSSKRINNLKDTELKMQETCLQSYATKTDE